MRTTNKQLSKLYHRRFLRVILRPWRPLKGLLFKPPGVGAKKGTLQHTESIAQGTTNAMFSNLEIIQPNQTWVHGQ